MCKEIVCFEDVVCVCLFVFVHVRDGVYMGHWILLGKGNRVLVRAVCEFMDVCVDVLSDTKPGEFQIGRQRQPVSFSAWL